MNRRIELPEKIENIIAIGPGTLRLLAYMDTFTFIRGVEAIEKDKSMIYKRPYALANFNYIKKLPIIGNGGPGILPNFEKIISLKCDIIFATSYSLNQIELIQKKTNIPVVSLSYGNTNDIINNEIEKSLKLIGLILNKENRAKHIIDYINKTIRELKSRTLNNKSRNIKAYIGGLGFKGSHGFTGSTSSFPPFEILNITNILSTNNIFKGSNFLILDKEAILLLNPDYIYFDSNGIDIIKDNLKKDPTYFKLLKAVKNKNVYMLLPYNNYNTNIENALINTYYIGITAYPELFKDINIEKKADKIYKFFLSKQLYNKIKNYNLTLKQFSAINK
ncbi:MAG: ABC transporter substrate-binding protein [Deferribacterota bacterium]|nr:ABC transporter substrate-binding protein [Deferribacterota bacterium]